MTLMLNERQRAMLAEMSVKVWMPRAGNAPESTTGDIEPPASAGSRQARIPAARATPIPESTPEPGPALSPRPAGIESMDWPALEAAVAGCRACGLCTGRTQTVFGVGSRTADWMVVGEAPGEHEDRLGQPFVGQAGRLLDNMLAAIGRSRQAEVAPENEASQPSASSPEGTAKRGVYIANVLKCRPPGNRNPQPAEVAQCELYLRRQVALIQPRIIVAMGRFAVQSLLQTTDPIGRLRGHVHHYEGVPVIVTYHPAYLLRALPEKAKAWQDLCLAIRTANKPLSEETCGMK
jgi:DNA polymerase